MKSPIHRLPLDAWFDDVPHPYDTWPMATDKADENPRPEEEIADDILREVVGDHLNDKKKIDVIFKA